MVAILNERYKLQDQLGQGGMGAVYRAHDHALDREVVIKVLSNTDLGTEGRARLLQEAQARGIIETNDGGLKADDRG